MTTINETLSDIQRQLHAPKDKNNSFGGYKYRNAEGILAAFKALSIEGVTLVCRDELQEVGGQIFVTARAVLTMGEHSIEATGHAMHPLQKKGMDASQITGSASSYARKYALCGLFAIEDESQDPDSRDNRQEQGQTPPPFNPQETATRLKAAIAKADTCGKLDKLWSHEATKDALGKMGNTLCDEVTAAYEMRAEKITTEKEADT